MINTRIKSTYTYLKGTDSFLYVDKDENLQKVDNNGQAEFIASNIILNRENIDEEYYDFIQDVIFGYVPNISETTIASQYDDKSYGASMNGETIAYIDSKLNLYVKKDDEDCKKIDSYVTSFTIDYTGEYVYYLKNSGELYVYNNDESKKISNSAN